MKELIVTQEIAESNPSLEVGQVLDLTGLVGVPCSLPAPTIPPPGYAPNSTRYCDNGEWKWINGEIA